MNPLDRPCPRCRAPAGQRCKNYLGKNKQTCPARGGLKRHAASARRKNAKAREEMPLFAHLEPEVTARDEYWHWRRNRALAADHLGRLSALQQLDEFQTRHLIRRVARQLVGDEWFFRLDEHCQEVYRCPSYWRGFWRNVLTGGRVVLSWRKVAQRQPGRPAVVEGAVYQEAHMTAAELEARFPWKEADQESGFEAEAERLLALVVRKR